MVEQVVGAAVDGIGRDDVVAGNSEVLESVGHGGGSRGDSQSGYAPFEGGDASFENLLCGVAQPAVDVARLFQVESGGGVSRVAEHVGGCLIDGYGPGVGGRVGLLLSHMEL